MKFENTKVYNFEGAIRGMRNPMNSWSKSDSWNCDDFDCEDCLHKQECHEDELYNDGLEGFYPGEKDLALAQHLIRSGSDHRKFMRQIFVSVDITAPLYWWKEFDTYKVGTVSVGCSTMNKLASTPITLECFEMDDFQDVDMTSYKHNPIGNATFWWEAIIETLESLRQDYIRTKDKRYWKELIRLLPESWLQKRTVTMNYENILNMIRQRRMHKLTEWSETFIDWAKTLPRADRLLFIGA